MYLADDDSPSEPDFQYIPDTPSLASIGGDPLTASMTLLKDGLDTGTTVAQFEVCRHSAVYAATLTHTRLTALCPGLPGSAGTRK